MKAQYEFKKALEDQKLKEIERAKAELELLRASIRVIELQMKAENILEAVIPNKVKEEARDEVTKWYAVFNGPFPGICDDWYKAFPHC